MVGGWLHRVIRRVRWSPSVFWRVLVLSLVAVLLILTLFPATIDNITYFISGDSEVALLDRYKTIAYRHIQWAADDGMEVLMGNSTDVCRNTRQGRNIVTDDKGFVCLRRYVDASGCCGAHMPRDRFACGSCRGDGCCAEYEHCVSCCSRPDQKGALVRMIESTRGHRLRQILSARDQFELCSIRCRTSSSSVRFENKYKDPQAKHCFQEEPD